MIKQASRSRGFKRPRSKPAFYLDEGVHDRVAETLRTYGCNVELARSKHQGELDVNQLIYATKEKRIMVVFDQDFDGYTFPKRRILESPGVVVFSTADPSAEHFQQLTLKLLRFIGRSAVIGKVCRVSDAGVRVLAVAE